MIICFVFQDEYPWDVRIEKFLVALEEAGHEVHLVSRNRTGRRQKEWISDRICIHRLPGGFGTRFRDLVNTPAFFSPVWFGKICRVVAQHRPRVIIVRDIPLGPTAIVVGKLFGVPVITDVAEDYPAMILDTWTYRGPKPIDYLIRNPCLLRVLERWTIRHSDAMIAVSDFSKSRLSSLARGAAKNIQVVDNTPRLEAVANNRRTHKIVDLIRDHAGVSLLYVGGLEEFRGLRTAVEAIPYVLEKGVNVKLFVVGEGTARRGLEAMARDAKLVENVHFAGNVDAEYIPSIISSADICIIPHYVTPNIDTTVPNKIYDYMAQGKPVISTHARALRHIIETHRCGRVYEDKDPRMLAESIVELADSKVRDCLGAAGRLAVIETRNWQVDKKALLDIVSSTSRLAGEKK